LSSATSWHTGAQDDGSQEDKKGEGGGGEEGGGERWRERIPLISRLQSSRSHAVLMMLLAFQITMGILPKQNKSDISYLKTSRAFDVPIHSRALLAAILCWLATP